MAKAAKKKPARKRLTKAANGEIVAKRAEAYLRMEPNLRDCEKLARLAGQLSLDHDLYDYVVHEAAEKMEQLVADYYDLDFQPWLSSYLTIGRSLHQLAAFSSAALQHANREVGAFLKLPLGAPRLWCGVRLSRKRRACDLEDPSYHTS